MRFKIDVQKLIDPGVYKATITEVDTIEGKFGTRLQIKFELPDGGILKDFFPPIATPTNKTGRLFERAFGKLEAAYSDDLIGKTVNVEIEHTQYNGRTYSKISKIL